MPRATSYNTPTPRKNGAGPALPSKEKWIPVFTGMTIFDRPLDCARGDRVGNTQARTCRQREKQIPRLFFLCAGRLEHNCGHAGIFDVAPAGDNFGVWGALSCSDSGPGDLRRHQCTDKATLISVSLLHNGLMVAASSSLEL